MNADHAVLTGSSHYSVGGLCQDYAGSGICGNAAWAAVADGCSGAGRSDLGARAWLLSTETTIAEEGTEILQSANMFEKALQERARAWSNLIKKNDMVSTLCVVGGTSEEMFGHILGDGAIVKLYVNLDIELIEVSYSPNAPEYPCYSLNEATDRDYLPDETNNRIVTRSRITCGGTVTTDQQESRQKEWTFSPQSEQLLAIGVVTDGIESREGHRSAETIAELITFKSTAGSFMQRRLGSIYRRQWQKNRTEPKDDLAIGMIWIGTSK